MLFCLATWFAGGLFHDLQFTLPGVSNIYYGSEIGMVGGNDPENGEPLRWELVQADNPALVWVYVKDRRKNLR